MALKWLCAWRGHTCTRAHVHAGMRARRKGPVDGPTGGAGREGGGALVHPDLLDGWQLDGSRWRMMSFGGAVACRDGPGVRRGSASAGTARPGLLVTSGLLVSCAVARGQSAVAVPVAPVALQWHHVSSFGRRISETPSNL